jgi:hypothetical protein
MSLIDYLIFGVYMVGVMAMGVYYYLKNRDHEDYYVGGRTMGAGHIGLSIVATDVGGGFSIGLGGLGFVMGLSGSWLLFTGLLGAWLAAVVVIPRVKALDQRLGLLSYPDVLRHRYGEAVALLAALVSGLGYLGFTSGQVLAGAKLASATIITTAPWGLSPLHFSLLVIAVITVAYTVLGGLKAVIYTDTIQWSVLLVGLIAVALPVVLWGELGGIAELRREPGLPGAGLCRGGGLELLGEGPGRTAEVAQLREAPGNGLVVGVHDVLDHAHPCAVGGRLREQRRMGPAVLHVLEDDRGVEDRGAVLVHEGRDLPARIGGQEGAAARPAADGFGQGRLEGDPLLEEGDLHLLGIGRERVVVDDDGHGASGAGRADGTAPGVYRPRLRLGGSLQLRWLAVPHP